MKKIIARLAMVVSAIVLLSSCGLSQNLTSNTNLQQTNVVLSQKNFHVVKNVEANVTAKYWFGIGGINKSNISQLSGTGVDGVALVSAIFAADDIESECRQLRRLSEEMVNA